MPYTKVKGRLEEELLLQLILRPDSLDPMRQASLCMTGTMANQWFTRSDLSADFNIKCSAEQYMLINLTVIKNGRAYI